MTDTKEAYANYRMPSSGGSGDLLKPQDGKTYKIRIVGEAVVYQSKYDDNVSTRYAMRIWNYTDNCAQVMQLPAGAFQQIVELANGEWGDPTSYNLAYKRTGTALETRHTLQPSASKEEPTTEQLAQVESIDLKETLERFPGVSLVFYISEADDPKAQQKAKEQGEIAMLEEADESFPDAEY